MELLDDPGGTAQRGLWATIGNPRINLIDERFVADLIALLDATEAHGGVRGIVFRSGDPDFVIPYVDLERINEYTAVAATSCGSVASDR